MKVKKERSWVASSSAAFPSCVKDALFVTRTACGAQMTRTFLPVLGITTTRIEEGNQVARIPNASRGNSVSLGVSVVLDYSAHGESAAGITPHSGKMGAATYYAKVGSSVSTTVQGAPIDSDPRAIDMDLMISLAVVVGIPHTPSSVVGTVAKILSVEVGSSATRIAWAARG